MISRKHIIHSGLYKRRNKRNKHEQKIKTDTLLRQNSIVLRFATPQCYYTVTSDR